MTDTTVSPEQAACPECYGTGYHLGFRENGDCRACEIAASPEQAAQNDAVREALIDARDNGLIYWEPNTARGHAAKYAMIERIGNALAATPPAPVGRIERRRQFLLKWFQPDSGEETVNFVDRDGEWTILTFLRDLTANPPSVSGEAIAQLVASRVTDDLIAGIGQGLVKAQGEAMDLLAELRAHTANLSSVEGVLPQP